MKTKKFLLLLVMQILVALPLVAQELFINDIVAKPLKASTLNAKDGDTINDYQAERQLIDNYLKQINPNFSAGKLSVIVDLINEKHYRCNVFYKQIPVDEYRLTLHPLTDTTLLITGMNLFSHDIVTTPSITKEEAIEELKLTNNLVTDESVLLNELVIYKALKGEPHLCYKIEVFLSNLESYCYFISAENGEIIKKMSLEISFSSEVGMADLENWGTQNISTSYDANQNKYILFDQIANIQTYDSDNLIIEDDIININSAENFTDLDNNWTFAEYPETYMYSPNAALVCHWGARKVYDFFLTTFNRVGYDGNNKKLNIYINYDVKHDGNYAAWSPLNNAIKIGSGNANEHHYGVVDVIAHEYGHAVTRSMVGLISEGESGAINEGIADIWAVCVENYLGASSDEIWNIGDHRGYVIRNMANPNDVDTAKTYLQPDTYGGTYWINPDTVWDDGAIHINSGVLNYWFYLLTMGGSGTNDNQESYKVNGLGFSISQCILYQVLLFKLERDSNFPKMKEYTSYVTARIYGENSNEHKQVINAWHAVGVGEPYINEGNIVGDFEVCDGDIYSLSNFHPAASITWSVDSFTNIMNQKRPKLTITPVGRYPNIKVNRVSTGVADLNGNLSYYNGPVTLTATISYGNETYTRQKSLFVNTPLPDIKYTTTQQPGTSANKKYKFSVNNVASTYLSWRVEANGNVHEAIGQNYIEVSLPIIRPYDVEVSVTDNGGCPGSNYKTLTLEGITITWPILSHENPVITNSVFYLKKTTDEPNDGAIYNIEIWNDYGLIRSERYEDADEFMVSTEGLVPGVYFLRVYRNGEFLGTQKLIVE